MNENNEFVEIGSNKVTNDSENELHMFSTINALCRSLLLPVAVAYALCKHWMFGEYTFFLVFFVFFLLLIVVQLIFAIGLLAGFCFCFALLLFCMCVFRLLTCKWECICLFECVSRCLLVVVRQLLLFWFFFCFRSTCICVKCFAVVLVVGAWRCFRVAALSVNLSAEQSRLR